MAIVLKDSKTAAEPDLAELLRIASDPATDEDTLYTVLELGAASMELARRVARHPNCSRWLVYCFKRFLPDEVKQSAAYAAMVEADPRVAVPFGPDAIGTARRPMVDGLTDPGVSPVNPPRFKVEVFLRRGELADIRFLVGLDGVADDLVAPYIDHKDVHVRKALAGRRTLPEGGFARLARDRTRSVQLVMAANPAAPAEVLAQLSQDGGDDVRAAVLANPACPPAVTQAHRQAARAAAVQPAAAVDSLDHAACRAELADTALAPDRVCQFGRSARPFVRAAAGVHANAPQALLRELATDPEVWVRSAAAFHPATPADCLSALAESTDPDVQLGLACNPATPPTMQLRLAQTGEPTTRRALADVAEDPAVLQALCEPPAGLDVVPPWATTLQLVLNPATKAQKLRSLHHEGDVPFFANKFAARHVNAPPSLLGLYAHYLFDSLAQNPVQALKLIEDPHAIKAEPYDGWKINEWLTGRCAPGQVAEHLARHGDADQQRRVVSCPALMPQRLLSLMLSDDLHLLKRLTERAALPRIVLEWLGRHEKEAVRERVAGHAAASAALLTELAQDKVNAVRTAALQHPAYLAVAPEPQASPAAAAGFKNKGPRKDRIRMATQATAPEVLTDLATDKDEAVRLAVLRNDKAPAAALDLIAHDSIMALRRELAGHRIAEVSDVERAALLHDAEESVRASAMRSFASHIAYREGASETDETKRLATLRRQAASAELQAFLDTLRARPEAAAREVLARYTIDPELQLALLNEVEAVLLQLSANTELCEAARERLCHHEASAVRAALAQATLDVDSYLLLLDDPSEDVVAAALDNYDIYYLQRAVQALVGHANPKVRKRLAYLLGPQTVHVAAKLVQDDDIEVLRALAEYGRLPKLVREHLNERGIPEVLRATMFEHFSAEQLERLSAHDDPAVRATMVTLWAGSRRGDWHLRFMDDAAPQVRLALVESGALPKAALRQLATDVDRAVREAAKYRAGLR